MRATLTCEIRRIIQVNLTREFTRSAIQLLISNTQDLGDRHAFPLSSKKRKDPIDVIGELQGLNVRKEFYFINI